jgi:protein TonB
MKESLMLAYAARRSAAGRQSSPNTMLFIIAAHVAALALVMSARMDLPRRIFDPPIKVDSQPAPPKAEPVRLTTPQPEQRALAEPVAPAPAIVPVADPAPIEVGTAPAELLPGPVGGGAGSERIEPAPPRPTPVSRGALLLTRGDELKPPYPLSKQALGEEATLMLRLGIDERGRVITVDPVGVADRTFAEAARRHIILHWRFRPATYAGRPTTSWTVINLSFQLDD